MVGLFSEDRVGLSVICNVYSFEFEPEFLITWVADPLCTDVKLSESVVLITGLVCCCGFVFCEDRGR